MDICLFWVLCLLSEVSDHSSRGVLLNVVLRCVWPRNLVNEKAKTHFRGGYRAKRKQKSTVTAGVDKLAHVSRVKGTRRVYTPCSFSLNTCHWQNMCTPTFPVQQRTCSEPFAANHCTKSFHFCPHNKAPVTCPFCPTVLLPFLPSLAHSLLQILQLCLLVEIRTQDQVTIRRLMIVPLKWWNSSNIWEQR